MARVTEAANCNTERATKLLKADEDMLNLVLFPNGTHVSMVLHPRWDLRFAKDDRLQLLQSRSNECYPFKSPPRFPTSVKHGVSMNFTSDPHGEDKVGVEGRAGPRAKPMPLERPPSPGNAAWPHTYPSFPHKVPSPESLGKVRTERIFGDFLREDDEASRAIWRGRSD